ncbi:GNAT family N-acetyltransferase [Thalassomonas actiniarum]|uniref:GNAT family N-acetyltransferase n=1 Tax=Thalassomonas actiniarum TaxID=485447 RepID=A0AAE9YNU9_9GAMM|nr:GNAT family N-acetyltransferase [Thalassomonas actiniarum]WDD98524.1 GNAT family N-acetyltransferase [Thalassomonas actiniarum]
MQENNGHHLVSLRKHTTDDLAFMQALYASTREAELAMTNFTRQEKEAFIQQQFNAQYQHYLHHYNSDKFDIIEFDGQAIGRLFVDHWDREIRIVDITLTPDYQNKGIGSYLFKQLFEQAKAGNKAVTIHVEHNNPAKNLYQRLGFELKTQTNEIYLLMQWTP